MLDINLLRKDLDSVVARLQTRKNPQAFLDVDAFKALEAERKTIQIRTEELQSKRNTLSKQIGMLKAKGTPAEVDAVMAEVAGLKSELETSATRLDVIQGELGALLLGVPNLPHESVPVGPDESGNVEVRRWGTPAKFDFEVKDHVDVGTPLGLDFDMGVKLSGSRFTVMKGPIARLHRALALLDERSRALLTLLFLQDETPSYSDIAQRLQMPEGSIGPTRARCLQRLRDLSPGALAGKRPAFQDPRLEELLFRYRARNWPQTLDDGEQARWLQHCQARLHEGAGGGNGLNTRNRSPMGHRDTCFS